MASTWLERAEQNSNDEDLLKTISNTMDIDLIEWRFIRNFSIKGTSETVHTFDYVLQSIKTNDIVPVLNMRDFTGNRYEKILLHRVKTADIGATSGVILVASDLDPKERSLCNICNFNVVRAPHNNSSNASYNIGKSLANRLLGMDREVKYSQAANKSKRRNRDRTKITQEILETVFSMEGASITQLIYRCNLNYKSAKEIMGDLIKRELIKTARNGDSNMKYEITDRGKRILERLRVYESV